MITEIRMVTLYVRDQEEALRFYTEKLGYEVRMDSPVKPGTRWLTVGPKGGAGPGIILYDPRGWQTGSAAEEMMKLVGKQGGMVVASPDCRRAVEALHERGVTVVQQPSPRPYGLEAVVADLYGNTIVIVEDPR